MESCLGDYHLKYCIIYLDDIIIFSKTSKKHISRLHKVFQKLDEAGLHLKPNKCKFFRDRLEYLGHVVSSKGIETIPRKIAAIINWPRPKNITQIRSFLGFCNYYRKFIRGYAQVAKPLYQLLTGENAKKKTNEVEWTEQCEQAFNKLKEICSDTPILAYADYTKCFKVHTDASEQGLGAVLYQDQDDGTTRVIAYASRNLSKLEKRYHSSKGEFLALKWSVCERFHEYLYGGKFQVYTDNNPLMYILTTAKLDATGQWWVASLANYDFTIHCRSGKQNTEAYALSRIKWKHEDEVQVKAILTRGFNADTTIPLIIDSGNECCSNVQIDSTPKLKQVNWIKEQSNDEDIGPVVELVQQGRHLQYTCKEGDSSGMRVLLKYKQDLFIRNGLLYQKVKLKNHDSIINQFVLPKTHRCQATLALHDDYGHLGLEKTLGLLQERFFWPKMIEDVRNHIRTCERCTKYKGQPEREK